MNVTIGRAGLCKSWEQAFPEETKCCRCPGMARIGFVAHERIKEEVSGKELVADLHKNEGEGGHWLHDCCAVAVYFCKNCLNPTALYNQA